jgi:hypothetical protein
MTRKRTKTVDDGLSRFLLSGDDVIQAALAPSGGDFAIVDL